nr:interleukin-15 receptor subunit alpha isoform X2 [Misgurnus anguillicaudatus]
MHVLVIFIFVTAEYHHNIVGASGVCEPLIQENNTLPVNSTSMPVNTRIRTPCKEGYLRKPGTSNMYRCAAKGGKLSWINDLKLECIPDPRIPPVKEPPVTMASEISSSTWSTSRQNITTGSPPTQSSTLSTTTDAPRTELNLTTSTTEKIQTICVTIKPKTEATNEGTTNETTTYPTTEPSVNMTSEILSSTRSTSRQNITTGSPPTQSSKPSTTTGANTSTNTSASEHNQQKQHDRNASIIGVAGGIILVCLVAAAAVLWWRCKRRATNPANEIQLDHTNYAACITYIPVPVSEHCSAEPPDMDAAANKSTTDSQTE